MKEELSSSCCIVGNDTLVIQCAEILLKNNINILGIVTDNSTIVEWSQTHEIPAYESFNTLLKASKPNQFDFLFSIVPNKIFSKEILKLPQRFAINYHDAPLPKYAGLNATTWAILNNEKSYGITWHLMDELIDGGDILKQKFFDIEPDETALSLNLKCYEHAIQSFEELIPSLIKGSFCLKKQNLTQRTYYPLTAQLPNEGFIAWDEPAEDISKLCRALTFGNYPNSLGAPKLVLQDRFFLVKNHQILNTCSNRTAGTIVAFNDHFLQIATASKDILLLEIAHSDDQSCSIAKLTEEFKIQIGYQLPSPSSDFKEKIRRIRKISIQHEKFWLNKLFNIKESSNFDFQCSSTDSMTTRLLTFPVNLQQKIDTNHILAVILTYLYRMNNYNSFTVGFGDLSLQNELIKLEQFLSNIIPFHVNFEPDFSFSHVLYLIKEERHLLANHFTFLNDIIARYPQLNESRPVINHIKKNNIVILEDQVQLTLLLNNDISLESLHRSLVNLITFTKQNPEETISNLCMVDQKEKRQLIYDWNNTQSEYSHHKTVCHIFEEQAQKTPDLVALMYEDKIVTYDSLNKKSNQIAHFLKNRGLPTESIIGICLERDLDIVAVILGVMKTGLAYLPLEPNYPIERLSYMTKDSKAAALILNQSTLKNKFSDFQGHIFYLSELLKFSETEADDTPLTLPCPENLAYVIYTSGSTGNPKGVTISHRSLHNHMTWMQRECGFNKQDIFLQKTPFSFDASVWEFFISFYVSGKLVIAPKDAYANSEQLIDLIISNHVTVLQVVPSILKELLAIKKFKECVSLKKVYCGGEALTPELIGDFFKKMTIELHNLYGPTEATIDTTTWQCSSEDGKLNSSLIGKPIMNVQVYVLDQHIQLLPIGVMGELFIGGEGIATGYLHQSELTQTKFIDNPFDKKNGTKLYRTGDIAKWRQDGRLEYWGRCDDQVKIRGCRIELTEVEHHIAKFPSVKQCMVMVTVHDSGPDNQFLVAYLTTNKNLAINPQELRNFLRQSLPSYMIPNYFYLLDHFSKTPNGKIDRKNFSNLTSQLLTNDENYTAPSNHIEELLVDIWESILKTKPISIHDNFFDLGGNSLDALRISTHIYGALKIKVSLGKLFEFPTIHELAKIVENDLRKTRKNFEIRNKLKISSLIHLHKGYFRAPLFLIHPIGGGVFWYKYLARYIDHKRSLYAIQDPGIEANEFLFETLEEMAAFYVEIIQKIQSSGPYLLGGASFGATVAIEIAKQLQERGEIVEFVGLLDGWAFYHALENDKSNFDQVMREQNQRIFTNFIQNDFTYADFLLNLQWQREEMLSRYQIPKLDMKLTLFKAMELWDIFTQESLNGWQNYTTQPVDCHLVCGNHETMFYEPNVQVLAGKLNQILNLLKLEQRYPEGQSVVTT